MTGNRDLPGGVESVSLKLRNVASLLTIAGLAASCATQPQPTSPGQRIPRNAGPSFSVGPAISARDYVSKAGAIDLFVIKSSELARQRAGSRETKDVADRLMAMHMGASSELSLAGRRLNLLPSATLDGAHQAMLTKLQSAVEFDREYKKQMDAVHREAWALHSSYASHGSSPTLRPVAAAIAPTMQQALRLLSYL